MTLTQPDLSAVADELEASLDAADAALYRPRYNVAPTDLHFVSLQGPGARLLVPARWGLGEGKPLINARAETAGRRGHLGRAWHASPGDACGRCAVPADGFFEWTGPSGDRRPLWFHRPDGGLLYFAGLWERGPDGRPAFTVLTTAANALVGRVHDRMPVVLPPAAAREWMARPAQELLVPAPEAALAVRPVSPRVNSVRNDDRSLLDAAPVQATLL